MSAINTNIEAQTIVGVNSAPPTQDSIWLDFTQGGEVFILDRSTVVGGPFGDGDMEDAIAQYTVLYSTTPSTMYRIANLETKYRLIIVPGLFRLAGKQLDL